MQRISGLGATRKIMGLLERILSSENIRLATQRVQRNRGSAGIDGIGTEELESHMSRHWEEVSQLIKAGHYQPNAVRGVEIPKPKGGKRLLGIPVVMDRVIQQAIQQVLTPIFDYEFSAYSYGFRPGRNAQQAVLKANEYVNANRRYIVSLDLENFFDRVNHDYLMSLLHHKVKDPKLLKLVRRYLQSGIMLGGMTSPRSEGTPQGGPLSPLLSNIILDELDKELECRGHCFVRYADDCNVFLKSKSAANRVKASITSFIEVRLRLPVNRRKTAVKRPHSVEILGYRFLPTYQKKGEFAPNITKASLERLKEKIKTITRKTIPMSFDERMTWLRRLVHGWINYFKLGGIGSRLKQIDSWVRNRLRYCIWHHWKKPIRKRKNLIRLGIAQWQAYAWSNTRMGGWAVACSPILRTTITVDRLKQRGYLPFYEYYDQVRHA
jgi:RNA-directed DNA polymerase